MEVGDVSTCTASARQHGSIEDRTDSILHGNINLRNECTHSGWSNRAIVDGSVSKSAESRVQQHLQDDNKCKDGSACGNDGSSNAIVAESDNSAISNKMDQTNQCRFTSICENHGSNDGKIQSSDSSSISQHLTQSNRCYFDSNCTSTGSTQAFIDGENNKNINQQLDQKNLCLSSTCTLTGALSGDSSKVSQSNVCVNEANCKNTGENSKTVCVQSASCENNGVGTTVISRAQDCSSGDPGTVTVCTNGRIITR